MCIIESEEQMIVACDMSAPISVPINITILTNAI